MEMGLQPFGICKSLIGCLIFLDENEEVTSIVFFLRFQVKQMEYWPVVNLSHTGVTRTQQETMDVTVQQNALCLPCSSTVESKCCCLAGECL